MNWDIPIGELVAIMLGAARAGAWLMLCPPFNSRLIPSQVKVLLSIGLALPMAPYLTATVPIIETSAIIASAVLQIFVGAASFAAMMMPCIAMSRTAAWFICNSPPAW